MEIFSSVSRPLWSAATLRVDAKSRILPISCRGLRSLCFLGALLLITFYLLSRSTWQPTEQPGEGLDASPTAATRGTERRTDARQLSRRLAVFFKDVTPGPDGRNIYQIVTTSADTLKGRHYCSLESFCKQNPGSVVWLLFLDQSVLVGEPLQVLIQLEQTYPNLRLAQLELRTALRDTPLQDLLTSGKLGRSQYPANHLSDMLRLSVVYKAGGLYTDFDFICWRSVEDVRNSMALAIPDRLMNGLFHFEANHTFLNLLLKDASKHFDGSLWSHNGPLLLTRTAKKLCPQFQFLGDFSSPTKFFDISALLMYGTSFFTGSDRRKRGHPSSYSRQESPISFSNVIPDSGRESKKSRLEAVCDGVGVLGSTEFMPVSLEDIDEAFNENSTASFVKALGAARGLHLFNYKTGKWIVTGGSAIGQVIARHCHATLGAAKGLGLQL